ncbi:hypothetical protein CBL_10345 [Carabus blaptoides fortunei]
MAELCKGDVKECLQKLRNSKNINKLLTKMFEIKYVNISRAEETVAGLPLIDRWNYPSGDDHVTGTSLIDDRDRESSWFIFNRHLRSFGLTDASHNGRSTCICLQFPVTFCYMNYVTNTWRWNFIFPEILDLIVRLGEIVQCTSDLYTGSSTWIVFADDGIEVARRRPSQQCVRTFPLLNPIKPGFQTPLSLAWITLVWNVGAPFAQPRARDEHVRTKLGRTVPVLSSTIWYTVSRVTYVASCTLTPIHFGTVYYLETLLFFGQIIHLKLTIEFIKLFRRLISAIISCIVSVACTTQDEGWMMTPCTHTKGLGAPHPSYGASD